MMCWLLAPFTGLGILVALSLGHQAVAIAIHRAHLSRLIDADRRRWDKAHPLPHRGVDQIAARRDNID